MLDAPADTTIVGWRWLYCQPSHRVARDATAPSASYMAQSTRAPHPDALARNAAANAPSAAVCPVRHSAAIPGSFTGRACSAYACGRTAHPAAWPTRSVQR